MSSEDVPKTEKNDGITSFSLGTPDSMNRTMRKKSIEINTPPSVPNPPPPSPDPTSICHYQTKAMDVIEDFYGTHIDYKGCQHHIKKFTWRNYNKLTVSVINYGAKIITMKAPDKRGKVVDMLLGFDEIGGHVKNSKYPLGACLGRCANYIRDSTFYLDRKIAYLSKNSPPHHYNGGNIGFDRVVWSPYVDKSKVIMTYVSNKNEEGYPGQLFIKITFELCNRNQFRIDYEAHCSEPTIVNLTHLCYFNLAGSTQGPEEIYNHLLTINANCYTVQDDEGIPTGEIKNVVNSIYDFQIPKCMSNVIGITPGDGYNQNYCINCPVDNQECFVARLFHPPSGRMLEIYSSQKGAVFSTGNEFGTGAPPPLEELLSRPYTCSTTSLVVGNVYRNIKEILKIDNDNEYFEMRDLIDLVKGVKLGDRENLDKIELTKVQRQYLEKVYHYCNTCEPKIKKCDDILNAIESILRQAKPIEPSELTFDVVDENEIRERLLSHFSARLLQMEQEDGDHKKFSNKKVVGKSDYLYKAHCGVAITPGNYPNAINTSGFPDITLRPGEVYKHSTSFRFWVRAGNPNNWIKRKVYEATKDEKTAARIADETRATEILGLGLKKKAV
ncbi:hypothetical protein HHI36_014186 [Cryptolaemus montrouzieri]|uniref:Galactose mutarotase n=1 Tax=Cryptolaemus montrouzieri TaxID=559131 RepID=A0ABD2N233_9CUCU